MALIKFCLPPKDADEFKRQIISGEIDPVKLAGMTSNERHEFFAKRFGDSAAGDMNRLLETKLLLKNQQQGMVNWAKKMMGQNTPAARDIVNKIKGMEKLLTPADEDKFLEELVGHRLGTKISFEEAKKIAELSKKVEDAKKAMAAGGDRMEYGRAVVNLRNYLGDLVNEAKKVTREDIKQDPIGAAGKGINFLASQSKALKASMDNSALFRQGWKTMWTHPEIWQRNARQSFVDLVKAFGSDQVMNEVNADIYSRPTYDLMAMAKLAVGVKEENYPTSLPEHIPVIGRAYRASEHAYSAFLRRTRADVFDKYLEIAKSSGVTIDQEQLESIGKLVNSMTGRGNLGALEPVANVINNFFFSPRMVKSQIDTLLLHPGDKLTPFAKKQAAINLLKILVGSAALLAIAKAVNKDAVDWDPRSANFGKIKVGNTRFDMTAGMGSVVTLMARELSQSSKSSTTNKVTKLGSGKFGSQTGKDVLYNFFEGKLSPAASVVKDLLANKTFSGEKPTVANETKNLFVPLPFSNGQELLDDLKKHPSKSSMPKVIIAMIADALGISTNTYDGAKPKR